MALKLWKVNQWLFGKNFQGSSFKLQKDSLIKNIDNDSALNEVLKNVIRYITNIILTIVIKF